MEALGFVSPPGRLVIWIELFSLKEAAGLLIDGLI